MLLSQFLRKTVVCSSLLVAATPLAFATSFYGTNGAEYSISGPLPGDQVRPDVALGASGGYLVWEDNRTDGNGLGISALKLNSGLSAPLSAFRVNVTASGNQERSKVALLNGGGAVFVWQGGKPGFQHVYARFISTGGTWMGTSDIMVNTSTNRYQMNPSVATLANGNVVVVWSSMNQVGANSMQDVYGQILSATGQKIGTEFLVNQFISYNQRTPSVAALKGGGFVVTWVSEQERNNVVDSPDPSFEYSVTNRASVDIYARMYPAGNAAGNEILVNDGTRICANPVIAVGGDGGFMISWGQKDLDLTRTNSWDIYARPFDVTGNAGKVLRVNSTTYGDQYIPQIGASGTDYLIVWTGLAQDGSMEGVFGQFVQNDSTTIGSEFQVNTTWVNRQIHPTVATDGAGKFLVVWSSFTGLKSSFDLFAQRYGSVSAPLQALSAPIVSALDSSKLSVSWSAPGGYNVSSYSVYIDGANNAAVSVTNSWWTMTGLKASNSHSFRVAYVLEDGRVSPLSPSSTGTTWGVDGNNDGLPDDWQAKYFGSDPSKWPAASTVIGGDDWTVMQAFLAGSNPTDSKTWLRTKLEGTPQGMFLSWNPQPGSIYQVQSSSDLANWVNVGSYRFAAGSNDSVYVGGSRVGYYRVVRVR